MGPDYPSGEVFAARSPPNRGCVVRAPTTGESRIRLSELGAEGAASSSG
jgi:hypothetical protein